MKRLSVIFAALAVLATGCSKTDTAPAVDDTHIQFKATLLPANEARRRFSQAPKRPQRRMRSTSP